MARKPPALVYVGGIPVRIIVDPELEPWGQYSADDKVIAISGKALAKSSTLRETLRHEILHAALDIGGISYLKHFEEEAIVRCIDNIFHPAWDSIRSKLT